MPRLISRTPAYRLHRASGQAVVTLDGRDFYLGPHGTRTSRVEYDRLIAEWLAHGRRLPASSGGRSDLSVSELILAFMKFAEGHYTRDGKPTRHLDNLRDALRPLRKLYGHFPASEFNPAALKAVRKAMIDSGLCRNTVNGRVGKLRSLFRWGVEEGLIPASVLHELASVKGLKRGRDGVRETDPIGPVPDEHVAAVLAHVSGPIRAMHARAGRFRFHDGGKPPWLAPSPIGDDGRHRNVEGARDASEDHQRRPVRGRPGRPPRRPLRRHRDRRVGAPRMAG
jgi:hypothetical protein